MSSLHRGNEPLRLYPAPWWGIGRLYAIRVNAAYRTEGCRHQKKVALSTVYVILGGYYDDVGEGLDRMAVDV
jgi:hypothetical protein